MSDSKNQIAASPEQIAANRANAAKSTGPRSSEGKARSAQNARKHGFAAANYTVAGFEDVQELADLKDDAADFYQPANSQEMFAVERIAVAQLALLRAARLEAGLFDSCLGEAAPDKCGQRGNLPLAEGFERLAAKSTALSLSMRYSAQAERNYRRAVAEFERLKALRPEILNEPKPAASVRQTNPTRPKLERPEWLDYLMAPIPDTRHLNPFLPKPATEAPLAES
jgi:hypothetical protein